MSEYMQVTPVRVRPERTVTLKKGYRVSTNSFTRFVREADFDAFCLQHHIFPVDRVLNHPNRILSDMVDLPGEVQDR